ncbi:MAG TPA: hypothetical protein VHO70_03950 [Chitinispirillaceae bacterium]|nr:hypothetical protein [Chitinispirillaceae bacterium]
MSENRVSFSLTQEQIERIMNAFNSVLEILTPICVTLTPLQKQQILKMGPATIPFVNAVNLHAQQCPQFVPSYIDAAELNKDVIAVKDLTMMYNLLAKIMQLLEDTIMLAGSEAMVASLPFYQSVKVAAKNNAPGAEVIYNLLKELLPQFRRKSSGSPEVTAAS